MRIEHDDADTCDAFSPDLKFQPRAYPWMLILVATCDKRRFR
jgi:hypothetical protein